MAWPGGRSAAPGGPSGSHAPAERPPLPKALALGRGLRRQPDGFRRGRPGRPVLDDLLGDLGSRAQTPLGSRRAADSRAGAERSRCGGAPYTFAREASSSTSSSARATRSNACARTARAGTRGPGKLPECRSAVRSELDGERTGSRDSASRMTPPDTTLATRHGSGRPASGLLATGAPSAGTWSAASTTRRARASGQSGRGGADRAGTGQVPGARRDPLRGRVPPQLHGRDTAVTS